MGISQDMSLLINLTQRKIKKIESDCFKSFLLLFFVFLLGVLGVAVRRKLKSTLLLKRKS